MTIPRSFALCGVVAPLCFATAVMVSAEMRPDYSHYAQFISELGETGSRSGPIMNYAGFILTGFLAFLASFVFWDRLGNRWIGTLGAACVSAFGLGIVASGVFSCDLSCTPETPTTTQWLHNLAGVVTFPSFIAAPIFLGMKFRQSKEWRPMSTYSLTTGAMALATAVALPTTVPDRSGTGMLQRLIVGLALVWLAAISWRLWASAAPGQVTAKDAQHE